MFTVHIQGAHSVMIATAAEANPSCFSTTPLVDLEETLVPTYLRLVSGHVSGVNSA
jgi:tRNA-dihydrouridine synthase 2